MLRQVCGCFEIIILQNDVASVPEKIEVREEELSPCYADLPMRKLQIRKKGKGNALNIGIEHAKYEFICVLDADCILDDSAICIAMQYFKDESVSAVGGKLSPVSEKKNLVTFYQQVEYMKTFNVWRPLADSLNANCLISGAYGIFRKSHILSVNGYDDDAVGEDMELVLSMQDSLRDKGKCIRYEALSICYTGVPTTMSHLLRQRDRWQRGLLDCILKHWSMILNPHYGLLGLFAMPWQLFVELLGPFFLLLYTMNLICTVVGIEWRFELILFFRNWIGMGDVLPQMWELYLVYFGFELSLTCIAEYIEHGRWTTVILKLPKAIVATVLGIILSVPLAMVRVWGMISFPWRRLVW